MNLSDIKETVFEYLAGNKVLAVTAAERWGINLVKKLKKKYPDDVEIVRINKDGSVYARFPIDKVRLRLSTKRELTEEQREEKSKHMREINNLRLINLKSNSESND